ncbi:MAG: pantothenate kinase, partial [Methanosarcinaceae archaeon]|nr:pantothenate kinase [Methanosarcinaceae archaeon]
MNKTTAFAPGHITGFFEIKSHNDIKKRGSTGCGIVINGGIETTVFDCESLNKSKIILNGTEVISKTTESVISMLTDVPLIIQVKSDIPIGSGFGASGAGALSAAYAINKQLSLNKSKKQLMEIARIAEIENESGLGDVIAQFFGGIVIRKEPITTSNLSRISCNYGDFKVLCVTRGQIPTKSVISESATINKINKAGKIALKSVLKTPTIDNFMHQSKVFSKSIEIMPDWIKDAIESVERVEGMGSQAMIGNTVFAIADKFTELEVCSALAEFGDVFIYNIDCNTVFDS